MIRVFSRYVAVQLVAYAIDMGGFLLLVALQVAPLPANVVAKIVAGGFAFLVHRGFTFCVAGTDRSAHQLLRYALLLAINVPVATTLLALLLPWLQPPALAKFVADAACVALSFLATRHLVFRSGASKSQ